MHKKSPVRGGENFAFILLQNFFASAARILRRSRRLYTWSENGAEIQQIKKISKKAPERVPALIYL